MLILNVMLKVLRIVIEVITFHTLKKYQDLISDSFAYKVVCIDDKFCKQVVLYRGRNAVNEFIKAILKEYNYCKNLMKKHFNKILCLQKMKKDFSKVIGAGYVINHLMWQIIK